MNLEYVEITSFDVEQYECLVTLVGESFGRSITLSQAGYREIVESENNHLLAILDRDKVVAMLILATYTTFSGGKKGYIEDVVVRPSGQGQGLGRGVMNFAIEFARKHGINSIGLTSSTKRTAAITLYKSLGFEKRETNCFVLHL